MRMSLLKAGTRIGNYTVLGKLAAGGMAEIYLARQGGHLGFSQIVALKLMMPHLVDDEQHRTMFRNEAKLAAMVNHPNVVQIFDFGLDEGVPYMALEYIDGRNLSRIMAGLAATGTPFPRHMAVRIISDVCGALGHAHRLTDSAGQTLDIVHRDISLSNILLTYAGQVKLVDFGVGKARNLTANSVSGQLKGKFQYMAPEMIEGKKVDHRADIFSAGVVLYRLLAGRLPFDGGNPAEMLHRICNQQPRRLSAVDKGITKDLDNAVLRALEKRPERRYSSASEMQAILERYLVEHRTVVMASQLAGFMASLFPPGTDQDRTTYQLLSGIATSGSHSGGTAASPKHAALGAAAAERGGRGERAATITLSLNNQGGTTGPPRPAEREHELSTDGSTTHWGRLVGIGARGRGLAALVALVLLVLAGFAYVSFYRSPGAPASQAAGPAKGASAAKPGSTTVAAGGAVKAGGAASQGALQGVASDPASRGQPPGGATIRGRELVVTTGLRSGRRVAANSGSPRERAGLLIVTAPGGALVRIDGKTVGSTPLRKKLRPGSYALALRSDRLGYNLRRRVTILSGQPRTLDIQPKKGRLRILIRPWADVSLDGNKLGTTPLAPQSVYEGEHRLTIENKTLGVLRHQRVVVSAGQEAVIRLRLDQP